MSANVCDVERDPEPGVVRIAEGQHRLVVEECLEPDGRADHDHPLRATDQLVRARVGVDQPDVRPPAQAVQKAEGVAPERHRVLLQHDVVALRQRVRDLLDERGLVGAVRDDALDLVVVGDVEREVDERPARVEPVVEGPRRPRPHPLRGVLVQQPPGAEVVVLAVVAQLALDVPGEDLRAAGLDRDAPELADRRRRLRERRAERLDLPALLRGQLAQLLGRRDLRVERVDVDAQRVREDRVQDEEDRDRVRVRDQVRDDPDRLVPDLGQRDVRLGLGDDPLQGPEAVDGTPDTPLLRLSRARLVVAVDVAEVRDRVGRLDSAHLLLEVDRRGELGDHVLDRARVDAAERSSLAARGDSVRWTTEWPRRSSSRPTTP